MRQVNGVHTRSIAALVALSFFALGVLATGPTLHLTNGRFEGVTLPDGTERILGIPYAEAPVGGLRLAPAQTDTTPPSTPRSGLAFGPPAPQANPQSFPPTHLWDVTLPPVSENNPLTINVWRVPGIFPHILPTGVMYIHAGGFTTGTEDVIDGTIPAQALSGPLRRGGVFITVQYRLGPLANLVNSTSFPSDLATCLGYQDIVFAENFIRENAHALGFDIRKFVPFGISAGGHAVAQLLVDLTSPADEFPRYAALMPFEAAEWLFPSDVQGAARTAPLIASMTPPTWAGVLAAPLSAFTAFYSSNLQPAVGPSVFLKSQTLYALQQGGYDNRTPVFYYDSGAAGSSGGAFFFNKSQRDYTYSDCAESAVLSCKLLANMPDQVAPMTALYCGTNATGNCAPYADCGDAAQRLGAYVFSTGFIRLAAKATFANGNKVFLAYGDYLGADLVAPALMGVGPGGAAPKACHAQTMVWLTENVLATQPATQAGLTSADLVYARKLQRIFLTHFANLGFPDLNPGEGAFPDYFPPWTPVRQLARHFVSGTDTVLPDPDSDYAGFAPLLAEMSRQV